MNETANTTTNPQEERITSVQIAVLTQRKNKHICAIARKHNIPFVEEWYLDSQGKKRPMYVFTKDNAFKLADKTCIQTRTAIYGYLQSEFNLVSANVDSISGLEDDPEDELLPDMEFKGELMSSVFIAKQCKKKHGHVMRDIRAIIADLLERAPELIEQEYDRSSRNQYNYISGETMNKISPFPGTIDWSLNVFKESFYTDRNGKSRPMYLLNKQACILLTTGYNVALRAKILNRWENLEVGKATPMVQQLKPMSQIQALLQSVQLMADLEQKQLQQESRINSIEQKFQEMEDHKKKAELELFSSELSDNEVPETTLRKKINLLVAQYAEAVGIDYRTAWRYLYQQMDLHYHVRFRENKERNYKKIDDVESRGLLPQMYDLISLLIKQLKKE